MSACFIPFKEEEGNLSLHIDGGLKAWEWAVEVLMSKSDDPHEWKYLRYADGYVFHETIKHIAEAIADEQVPENTCRSELKAFILRCAEQGHGILHFH